MIKRRMDSKILVWDANYINNRFMRSNGDKEFEIEQIEPCGNMFIVEVFKNERDEESVLIKGMKRPQSCYMCDMQELSGVVGCKHAYDTNNSVWGRALNCPLIELPDHGRLIDAKSISEKIDNIWDAKYWQ